MATTSIIHNDSNTYDYPGEYINGFSATPSYYIHNNSTYTLIATGGSVGLNTQFGSVSVPTTSFPAGATVSVKILWGGEGAETWSVRGGYRYFDSPALITSQLSAATWSNTIYMSQSGTVRYEPGSVTNIVYVSVVAPTVTTSAVSSIDTTTATGNGDVTSDGGAAITERGICWVEGAGTPTTANSKATATGTTGAYAASLTGLTSGGTLYSVRAYAINAAGTSYGSTVQFRTDVIVSYNANGGSVTPTSTSFDYNTAIGTLPIPTRSGYSFDSWNSNSSGTGSTITAATVYTSSSTIYAKWIALPLTPVKIYTGGTIGLTNGALETPRDQTGLTLTTIGTTDTFYMRCGTGCQNAEQVTVNAPTDCEVSKDGSVFGATAIYAIGDIKDVNVPCTVKRTASTVAETTWIGLTTTPRLQFITTEYY